MQQPLFTRIHDGDMELDNLALQGTENIEIGIKM